MNQYSTRNKALPKSKRNDVQNLADQILNRRKSLNNTMTPQSKAKVAPNKQLGRSKSAVKVGGATRTKNTNTSQDNDFGLRKFADNRSKSGDMTKNYRDDDNLSAYVKNSKQARGAHKKHNEKHQHDMDKSKYSDVQSRIMDVHNRVQEHLDDPKKDAILQKYLTMKNKLSFQYFKQELEGMR
jgi:hypothetical protein